MIRPRWGSRPGQGSAINTEQTERAARKVLADLLAGPDLTGASCTMTDPDTFYPEKGGVDTAKVAKAICRGGEYRGRYIPPCPVRKACLERALESPDAITHWGTWGGYTAKNLRRMRRFRAALRRAAPPATDQAA